MLEAGEKAPEFSLPCDAGPTHAAAVRLSALRGNPVIVYFYPKDDTSGCTLEAKAFSALAADFRATGAIVIGLSPDPVASHVAFKAKHALDLSLASDAGHEVAEAYGVWVEKSMYGRRYMGVERSTFLIDKLGRIARVWKKVKVPGHASEVLAAVQCLPSD